MVDGLWLFAGVFTEQPVNPVGTALKVQKGRGVRAPSSVLPYQQCLASASAVCGGKKVFVELGTSLFINMTNRLPPSRAVA